MSYYRLLGLAAEPFSTSPDPRFFYQSVALRSVLASLLIEVRLRRGLSMVLGDIGTGKTTLGRTAIQRLSERPGVVVRMVLDPGYPSEEVFLDALLRGFGIVRDGPAPSLVVARERLEAFLFQQSAEERQTVVLVIDEAHKLSAASLEVLRILLNYETNDEKLLQLILFGQLELLAAVTALPNLLDRVSYRAVLEPCDLRSTEALIAFRLEQAGCGSWRSLFTEDAVAVIQELTQGYPRRIAWLCHRALRALVMEGRRVADAGLVRQLAEQEGMSGWGSSRTLQKSGC